MKKRTSILILALLLIILFISEFTANRIMTNFGNVSVTNVLIKNKNGLDIRGKFYVPLKASADNPVPGVVYLHGYQNNRETSDPYGIELSRRGFAVLNIDTLGRGNSDNQFSEDEPGFDLTFGGDSAFEYLRSMPFVDETRCGLAGHSLGGEMSYTAALTNKNVKAVVFSGFAYQDKTVTYDNPPNILMIFGKYDEYRERMTGTDNFEKEWMSSSHTQAAISTMNPQFDTTYGSFEEGSARRVHMTNTTHVSESFDKGALSQAVNWFSLALNNEQEILISDDNQIWQFKELFSLIALISGCLSLLPLSLLLINIPFFKELEGVPGNYICPPKLFRKHITINGLLMFLYIPSIMIFFAIHVYLFPLDTIFPMMMINGIVLWFLIINIIGFLIFRGWFRKNSKISPLVNYKEFGLSDSADKYVLKGSLIVKTIIFGFLLFLYIYFIQAGLEKIFLIDFRFKFPYASDFTPYRILMFLEYLLPFFLGYLQLNLFLQVIIKRPAKASFLHTIVIDSIRNILVVILPLLIHMAIQYIPLFLTGNIPFVGPGGVLVGFLINLEHMCVLLALMIPVSTLLYKLTGKIYLGALVNALLVTWMFTSSSVIAPVPI